MHAPLHRLDPLRRGRPVCVLLALLSSGPAAEGQLESFPLRQQAGVLTASGDQFGFAVAAIGDVNGDSFADFVAGAPFGDFLGQIDTGRVERRSGKDGALLPPAFFGFTAGDLLGWSIARIGDVNASGTPDFVVGAPQSSTASLPGYVLVLDGSGSLMCPIVGFAAGDQFGYSVAGVGDVNNDGVPDFAVGAPFADPGGVVDAGEVRIFSGGSCAQIGAPLTRPMAAANDQFGVCVAGAGDVGGAGGLGVLDGVGDLIVGAWFADPAGMVDAGEAAVFSGATGTLLGAFQGLAPGDYLGASVSAAGNVTATPTPGILVGAPQGPCTDGYASLLTVGGGGVLSTAAVFAGPVLGFLGGDHIGWSVAGGGDLNGDGTPDIVVGAIEPFICGLCCGCGFNGCPPENGHVSVFSGRAPFAEIMRFSETSPNMSSSPGSSFGFAVAVSEDVSGDGLSDFLLIGRPLADPSGIGDAGEVRFAPIGMFSPSGLPNPNPTGNVGCAAPGGTFVPQATNVGGPSNVACAGGNPAFGVMLARAHGTRPAVLLADVVLSPTPFPLPGIVHPGCSLFVSPLGIKLGRTTTGWTLLGGDGDACVPLPIPASPSLCGAVLYFQWFVADPGPLVPGTLSEAIQVTL